MVKKRGLRIILSTIGLLLAFNSFLFLNKGNASYLTMSGMFIQEGDLPFNLSIPFIIFIALWIILIIIGIITYSKFLTRKKVNLTAQDYKIIKQKKSKSETDLDVLYHLLQNKKTLNTRTISKVFKITNEKALEWAKILENHKLVTIDYPTFSIPEVKIYEKQDNKAKQEKETNKENKKSKQGENKVPKSKDKKQKPKQLKPKK